MCGRYYVEISGDFQDIYRLFHDAMMLKRRKDFNKETGEIVPSMIAPVISKGRNGGSNIFPMKWGYKNPYNGGLIINARSETAGEKYMFAQSMRERRCIVPASYYFEYQKNGNEKIKYAFKNPKSSIIYMAGLYRFEEDAEIPVFTVLTREAPPFLAGIHERMPVILPVEYRNEWLFGENVKEIFNKALIEMTANIAV